MSFDVLMQIFVLFGLVLAGYLTNKAGIFDAHTNEKLSSFLLRVTLPCTIVTSAFQNSATDNSLIITTTIVAIAVFILVPVMSFILAKLFHWESTYQLMLNYSNLGFMGMPIVSGIFGESAIIYVAIFMMVFNIHVFTHGVITVQGKPGNMAELLKKLVSPGILAALLAYIIVLMGLSAPEPVTDLIGSIGSITTPLAMMVIGSQLAQVNIVKSMQNPQLYLMSAFRLLIYPLVIFFILGAVQGFGTITQIAALLMGLPVAGNVTMLCSEYDGNVPLAAEATCISTILSLATIPIILQLFAIFS